MRNIITLTIFTTILAGCGTFKLADDGGYVPPGYTQDHVQLDVLTCKDRARVESQTAADQARGIALSIGLSFLGSYIDYRQQVADQRRIYRECMWAKGYEINPPTD